VTLLVHLSDLHFGREEPQLAEALLGDVAEPAPTLVVVSGDVTQRARRAEFQAARDWLRRLPAPALVVPGNHDVPLYDVVRRFFRPLHRFRRYISPELDPFFHREDLAVAGLNTARSLTFKNGRISAAQMEALRARLAPVPERVFKVLVTHHPFVPGPGGDRHAATVGRGLRALRVAESVGVDLLLAGHLHVGHHGDVRAHHVTLGRSMLAVQAGTALSTRVRGEPNAYNRITIEPPHLAVEVRGWLGGRFETRSLARYVRRHGEWTQEV
jgi:3',5'-cyclic AMP phosphodiesterase CpdA